MGSVKRKRFLMVIMGAIALWATCMGCGEKGFSEYNKALEHQASGKLDLAEQEYKIALQKNPGLAEAHMNIGVIYVERGWLDGAEESTKKAIAIFEKTQTTWIKGSSWQQSLAIAYNNLGMVEINRAIQAERESMDAGEKERRRYSHWKQAMSYFEKAVELDSSNSQAHANIAKFQNAYSRMPIVEGR